MTQLSILLYINWLILTHSAVSKDLIWQNNRIHFPTLTHLKTYNNNPREYDVTRKEIEKF